jgi:predicted Zn-dependent protease with MMP-like domain
MITEIREVLEKHKEHIPVVAMAELLAVIDGAEEYDVEKVIERVHEVCYYGGLDDDNMEEINEIIRNGGKE